MIAASLFGLVREGLAYGSALLMVPGILAGVVLVVVAHELLDDFDKSPKQFERADFKKLLLILGILTVHSFPEGVAVGVSFAELGLASATPESAVGIAGVSVPLLAVFMTVAISIHNIPEGTAIAIPLRSLGVSEPKMVWWAVFSSLPQPIGAVIAYYFVTLAKAFLPFGFGFAAGAMVYLVLTEFVPEALEYGDGLPGGGKRELTAGVAVGVLAMVPLAFV
jgi:ZIP family zinc transporter